MIIEKLAIPKVFFKNHPVYVLMFNKITQSCIWGLKTKK
jgi:hypothetical protein